MDQSLIRQYLQGMASLYGAIAEDEALEIIRGLEPVPPTALELTLVDLDDSFVVRHDDILAHEAILAEEDLEDLLDWQDDKPFYVPDRETLLRYGDGAWFERSPAFEALRQFLVAEMGIAATLAEEICDDLHAFSSMSDLEPADVPYEFARRRIELHNRELADRLMQLVRALDLSTRQWANRGYSFAERPDPDFEFPEDAWVFNPEDLLLDTIAALINLYGAVPKLLAAEACTRVSGRPVTIEEIESIDFSEEYIVELDGRLVAAELAEDDDWYESVLEAQDGKPYYMPEPAELILYANQLHFDETPQFERLRAYLQKRWFNNPGEADAVAAEIALICREPDYSMELVIEWLEENGVRIESERLVREFSLLVGELAEHTRLWIHRGHTAAEIKALAAAGPR